MNDTDKPRRGTSSDEIAASGNGNPASSVEKAGEKLTNAQEARSSDAAADGRVAPDQTSSIERFLNANDAKDGNATGATGATGAAGANATNNPDAPGTAPTPIQDDLAPTPAEPSVSSTPVSATDAVPEPAQPADDLSTQQPPVEPPSAPAETENPYRAAHPDPEDLPQVDPNVAPNAAPNVAPNAVQAHAAAAADAPPRRGLLGRKQKATKPWHRDQAAEQSGEPEGAAPVAAQQAELQRAEMPAKRRGVFGMFWGTVRFLLIGRKRPKKSTAPAADQGARQASPRKPSRLVAGLTTSRRRVFRRMQPLLASRIGKIPGLRRLTHTKAEVVAEIERVASETPAGIAEIAAETRRSTAGSHIQRPLDMSRRVGRTVEIDIESIRAAGMVTPSGERTHIAEEFRLIKRPLLLNAFEKGANAIRNGNVIMVASSRSGEGKTFMAVNLAMSIASERDLTVLLIDADVAKPDIPNVLGFEADLGLVDLIADDQIDMSQVIMRTNIENLSVMPAGRPHHLATELLASERMENLVSELSLRYPERVVIMDSPPALLSSVAGVLALNVGQTLFVVEAERTSQTAVDSAIGLVSACKNINLLLNKSRPLGGGERFGSYQSSYY